MCILNFRIIGGLLLICGLAILLWGKSSQETPEDQNDQVKHVICTVSCLPLHGFFVYLNL